MTAAQISEGTFGDLAISSERASASVSERCFMTSVARSSPTATRNAAALRRPPSFDAAFGEAVATALISVLAQPMAHVRGDALGLTLHQLVELVHVLISLAGGEDRGRPPGPELGDAARGARGAPPGLELGGPDGGLDLARPARRAERLGLPPANAARHEEAEEQRGQTETDPLQRPQHGRRDRARLRGLRLGERDLDGLEDVAARAVDPGGALDGVLDAGEGGGRDGLVDQQRDLHLVHLAGRDLGLRDRLVDAVVGRAVLTVVAVLAAAAAGARRVGRDVGAGAGGAAAGRAAAAQLLGFLSGLQRRALLAVHELVLGGLVDVEIGADLHLRLARPERAGEHRGQRG